MTKRPCPYPGFGQLVRFTKFEFELVQWETGIRTIEIGLMFKTEIGLMEKGLFCSAALDLMKIGLTEIGLNNF